MECPDAETILRLYLPLKHLLQGSHAICAKGEALLTEQRALFSTAGALWHCPPILPQHPQDADAAPGTARPALVVSAGNSCLELGAERKDSAEPFIFPIKYLWFLTPCRTAGSGGQSQWHSPNPFSVGAWTGKLRHVASNNRGYQHL